MSKLDAGGPAFPVKGEVFVKEIGDMVETQHYGMSLRDWFAGQAMAGMLPMVTSDETDSGKYPVDRYWRPHLEAECECLATWAYKIADAMLAERSKPR